MIAIIKGCGSNIASLQYALERLGIKSCLTDDPNIIVSASHVILPGVGHAQAAMQRLKSKGLDTLIKTLTQPVLGICLGMQLLYEYSEEGNTDGLGIIPGVIKKLSVSEGCVIPHMGWNRLKFFGDDFKLNASKNHVYFVHSYAAPINQWTIAKTQYSRDFTAIVRRNNFTGMQFHPEKSGEVGERLLLKFIGCDR